MLEQLCSFLIFYLRSAQFMSSRSGELTAEIRGLIGEVHAAGLLFAGLVLHNLWREKPEQPASTQRKIDVDQRHTSFRKFKRGASQRGNGFRKIRLVTDDHQ